MAKLHFFYSTMNAGKSTSLLQSNHNYLETDLETMIFLPKEIESTSHGKIISRIGLEAEAIIFDDKFNFLTYVRDNKTSKLSCILIDESQFLTTKFGGAKFTAGKNEYYPIPQAQIDIQGSDILSQNPGY